jgi:GNAT superfamily N-acetyltransferase
MARYRFTQLYPTFCSVAPRTLSCCTTFVTPARGTGAGRALMQAAEAHARKTGAARMELSTAKPTHRPVTVRIPRLAERHDILVYGRNLRDE